MYSSLSNTAVAIGFINTPYEECENEGAVSITIGVARGTILSVVVVELSFLNGTARSKLAVIS
jgi:hypothetical protein